MRQLPTPHRLQRRGYIFVIFIFITAVAEIEPRSTLQTLQNSCYVLDCYFTFECSTTSNHG